MSADGKCDQEAHPDPAVAAFLLPDVVIWASETFALDWLEDARSASEEPGMNARRREILFSVCLAETFLVEWVRDEVLDREHSQLKRFFPANDRRGLPDRWKDVARQVMVEKDLAYKEDLFDHESWTAFKDLYVYRNGLIHANASRPEASRIKADEPESIHSPPELRPIPTMNQLRKMEPGWALSVVLVQVKSLCDATGVPCGGAVSSFVRILVGDRNSIRRMPTE